jgi:hypothetical protein
MTLPRGGVRSSAPRAAAPRRVAADTGRGSRWGSSLAQLVQRVRGDEANLASSTPSREADGRGWNDLAMAAAMAMAGVLTGGMCVCRSAAVAARPGARW